MFVSKESFISTVTNFSMCRFTPSRCGFSHSWIENFRMLEDRKLYEYLKTFLIETSEKKSQILLSEKFVYFCFVITRHNKKQCTDLLRFLYYFLFNIPLYSLQLNLRTINASFHVDCRELFLNEGNHVASQSVQ